MRTTLLALALLATFVVQGAQETPSGAPATASSAPEKPWAAPALRGASHGVPPPLPAAALPSTGAPVTVPAITPEPSSGLTGPTYSASATWCAPTPTQCQSWGGNAMFGAVFSFRDGDQPYWVHVTRGDRFADVLVVSFCACRGTLNAIDLSPSAFVRLAPLSRGRIDVTVEVLTGPTVTLPPTDTPDQSGDDPPAHESDDRMRDEVRGDELYQAVQ